jgi:hypothetical protein
VADGRGVLVGGKVAVGTGVDALVAVGEGVIVGGIGDGRTVRVGVIVGGSPSSPNAPDAFQPVPTKI